MARSYHELVKAASNVIGGVPETWGSAYPFILEELSKLPPVYEGYAVPVATFLIYVLHHDGFNRTLLFPKALLGERVVQGFIGTYTAMREDSELYAGYDADSMAAEETTFNDPIRAIQTPRLQITPLYRYLKAYNSSLEAVVTDSLRAAAIRQLRANPYYFFAYGPELAKLMPVTWEEI